MERGREGDTGWWRGFMRGGHVGGGGTVAPTAADLRYYRREFAKGYSLLNGSQVSAIRRVWR
jgi:hypothetical protein